MQNTFDKYIRSVSKKFKLEQTSEMGYRTEFENLLNELFGSVKSFSGIDHDAKAFKGNKPDFAIRKNNIPILYIEVKDIGVSLDKIEKSDQMNRYFGYANLVLSDYLEFRFYRNGFRYQEPIKIAEYDKNSRSINPKPENFGLLNQTLIDFAQSHKEPIRSGEHLAKIMGGKAQRIRDNVKQFLSTESEKNNEIIRVYNTIKKLLVHDLKDESFADMYAQTLVYGLFVARYHDDTPGSFTRQEARDLIPASNPLLRHFFDHITGINFDKRLEYIVNELCEIFTHADVHQLMKQYFEDDLWGKTHAGPDPVIHFYEDFLKEYDPDLRKKLGAYYTPLPIVRFIVRSVDYLLEKEFNLLNGLADTSKSEKDIHRVQILDPAVGTGTFLSSTIQLIYEKLKISGQDGRWPKYVFNDLLPRLHGFELMMAPYTIAHLKLSMKLKETGFKYFNQRRLGIYLTNSLEKGNQLGDLFTSIGFAESIAEESKEAALIKNNTPVMVVIGNPPYSGISSNETQYANSLVDKYKIEPGGLTKLKERKHWLNDDYVKFIAFAENMINKTGHGILGFITNHGYLDNPTFRGMRWRLLQSFDLIYIIDLHGNSNKKEKTPDGQKDENVFNIQQGVSIILGIKQLIKNSDDKTKVFITDYWGKKSDKFHKLNEISFANIKWNNVVPQEPNYLFSKSNLGSNKSPYFSGFSLNDLFVEKATGIVTARDTLVISENKSSLLKNINYFCDENNSDDDIRKKFFPNKKDGKYIAGDSRGWSLSDARISIRDNDHNKSIQIISYRPFDTKYIYYNSKMVDWGREKIINNFLSANNLGLIFTRQAIGNSGYNHIMITNYMADNRIFFSNKGIPIEAPLYLVSKNKTLVSNLNSTITIEIENKTGITSPEEILDYIYAVLHSPTYRAQYTEFLKIDFPRVPYPKDKNTFKALVAIGTELRLIHLLESPNANKFITTFPIMEGDEEVEKIKYENGKVWINKLQYFGNVPEIAWNFYIGGY